MASTTSQWQVYTIKHIINAEGVITEKEIIERVEPGHKLLEQSYSPNFIKGERGTPEYLVSSVMVITIGDGTVLVKTPQEYTVSEYEIQDQASLMRHYEQRWAAKPRRLLYRYCGLRPVLWYDYLEGKAAEYLRHDYLNGKAAKYLSYDCLKGMASQCLCPSLNFRIAGLVVGVLFLLLIVAIGAMVGRLPDGRLESTLKLHRDIEGLLSAARTVRTSSLDISHQASYAESMSFRIGASKLPDKDAIARNITGVAEHMHSISTRMTRFRYGVQDMAADLQWDHQYTLSRLQQRSQGSWLSPYSFENLMLPSKKALRQEWIDASLNLRDALAKWIQEAADIGQGLERIKRDLKQAERRMVSSQRSQADYVRILDGSWVARLNIFGTPTSIYEADIELADKFLPKLNQTAVHVSGLKRNMEGAYEGLNGLEKLTWKDKGLDMLGTFDHFQYHAHRSLDRLMKAINFEADSGEEKDATPLTVAAALVLF